jgi:hypothetical protein
MPTSFSPSQISTAPIPPGRITFRVSSREVELWTHVGRESGRAPSRSIRRISSIVITLLSSGTDSIPRVDLAVEGKLPPGAQLSL